MAPPPSSNSNGSTATTKSLALSPVAHPMMREVTEDTPADLLLGTMDLVVVLPSKASVRMTVNRRTPMMDLLIQVTTANKINPGGHIVLVRNERGIELRYKPSTPIGALDTSTIEIVPKNQVNEYMIVKKPPVNRPANQPFEQTFRLQVHLPRQQLYVMRVGFKTVLQDILDEVCQEKNLDIAKYELRHPMNLDEKLNLSNTLGDYGLQQVTVVSKSSKSHSVSTADIMAIQQNETGTKTYLDSPFKYSRSSVGDSSASSESAGSGCGVSRSDDDSRSVSPLPPPLPRAKAKLNTTVSNASSSSEASSTAQKSVTPARMDAFGKPKKRAPAPPGGQDVSNTGGAPRVLSKQESLPVQNHSRHSSDSSGYHDSSPSIPLDNLDQKRNQRPLSIQQVPTNYGSSPLHKSSATSLTNLTSVSSLSSTSLASSNGGIRNKRKAPKPPPGTPGGFTLQEQSELDEDFANDGENGVGGVGASAQSSGAMNNGPSPQDVKTAEAETDSKAAAEEFVVQTRKPLKQRSSSSMSSLSSPTSPSPANSTASSPLPAGEPDLPAQNAKAKSPLPVPEAALVAAEIDNARASSRNSQAASSSLPKPPPRTARSVKSRDSSSMQNAEPEPQPKPKPRPDRRGSNDMELDGPRQSPSKPKATSPAPAEASQAVNPLTRFGVKVLPNNALQERAARFPTIDASDKVSSQKNGELPENTRPRPATATASDKRLPVSVESKKQQPIHTSQARHANTSHELPLAQRLQKFDSRESSPSLDDDSDNLEENLELFEVRRQEPAPTQNRRETEIKDKADKPQFKNPLYDNHNRDKTLPLGEERERLNRWKNFESLDKADNEDVKVELKTPKRTKSATKSKSTSRGHLSSDNEGDSEGALHEGHAHVSSSESELSYAASADSGVPTTANPTPTPVSQERIESEQARANEEGSVKNETPVTSPTSEAVSANWSEILQSKANDQEANMEKALHTANFKVDETDSSNSISHAQAPKVEDNDAAEEDDVPPKEDEVKIKEMHLKKEKVPESDNSNSELDQMSKRKAFAQSSKSSNRNQISNLNSKLPLSRSSSEEDLRKPESAPRFTSMQNLSSGESDKDNEHNAKKKVQATENSNNSDSKKDEDGSTPNAKASNVMEPEIAQDPKLMQTFRVELEAQFEQWKEQFMQKHALSTSQPGSKESASASAAPSFDEQEIVPETPAVSVSEINSSPSATVPIKEKDERREDVHRETVRSPEPEPSAAVETQVPDVDVDADSKTGTNTLGTSQSATEAHHEIETSENPTSEMQAVNGESAQNGKDVQFYKYSGPPAIQMATWSERPRANISVKNDSDYKMGMGQHDPKTANEFRPKLGSAASRMHSFNGGPPASPTAMTTSKPSPFGRSNSSAVPAVVANWKQSLQTSEEERRANTPERPILIKESTSESPSFEEDKLPKKPASVASTLERPAKSKANFTITSASSTLERPAKKLNAPVVYGIQNQPSLNGKNVNVTNNTPTSNTNGVQVQAKANGNSTSTCRLKGKSSENSNSKSQSLELKEQTSFEKYKQSNNVTTVILNSNETNGRSSPSKSPSPSRSQSLRDKKAFFQGVSPVESPTKEVPTPPSVSMKSSIATIQKVFEQKREKEKDKEKQTAAEPPSPAREMSPSPSISSSSSFSIQSSRSSNSPTPTPEFIGGPSQSTLMVQKVLKANSFNAFANANRTSSPSSSIAPRPVSSPSPRSTPSPTVIDTSSNRIYQSHQSTPSSAPAASRDTYYDNNKAVIIIGGENNSTNNKGNVYTQKLRVMGMSQEKEPVPSPAKPSVGKLNINGHAANNTQVITINQTTTAPEKSPFGVTLKSKHDSDAGPVPITNLGPRKSIEITEGELSKRNVGPMKLAGQTPTPPPPPPVPVMPAAKPTALKFSSPEKKGNGKSSFTITSPGSNPTTPMSPDPRADIFNEIKNSGGHFKLKKTGSVAVLR